MLKPLMRIGLRKGVTGGSRAWLTIGLAASVIRALNNMRKPQPETLFSGELKPGETLIIKGTRPDKKSK